jgi:tryptophan-rich sensory protein
MGCEGIQRRGAVPLSIDIGDCALATAASQSFGANAVTPGIRWIHPVAMRAWPMQPPSKSNQALGLLGWLLLTATAAAIGAVASANAGAFYEQLVRPDWAPPAWLFGPVWTTLYALMALSAWLVWRARGFAGARSALVLFIIQLGANAAWSWLFFAWQRGGFAFAEVLILWLLIAATIASFQRLHSIAAYLLYPYLAWVTFAAALTFALWRLNPGLLS